MDIFLPGSRFTKRDAHYFAEYFARIMDSRSAGRRLARNLKERTWGDGFPIVELACGHGEFLAGMRGSIKNGRPEMIGVDRCRYLLAKAPSWLETIHSDITLFTPHWRRAGVVFSPCLLETLRDDRTVDWLLERAIGYAEAGFLSFTVHNGPEYIQRHQPGSQSRIKTGPYTVTIGTGRASGEIVEVEWALEGAASRLIYRRRYFIRPKPYSYWEKHVRRLKKVKRIQIYDDDKEGGVFRKGFIIYF